jgi:hypothetical protein
MKISRQVGGREETNVNTTTVLLLLILQKAKQSVYMKYHCSEQGEKIMVMVMV